MGVGYSASSSTDESDDRNLTGGANAFAGRRRQLRATCSTRGGPLLDDALIGTYLHGWLVLMTMDAARRKWHLSMLLTPDAARSV